MVPNNIAGKDPEDGKFFVAKKSVFNVSPKLYKTEAEIDDDLSGDLNAKFKVALAEFSKLGIDGVLQGDLMYTDLDTTTIDGTKYYTFQPNTIVYAVPVDSDLGATMNASKIGVVWHTTYTGNTLQDMKASFGVDIKGLKNHPQFGWMMRHTKTFLVKQHLIRKKRRTSPVYYLGLVKLFKKNKLSTINNVFLKLQDSFTGTLALVHHSRHIITVRFVLERQLKIQWLMQKVM